MKKIIFSLLLMICSFAVIAQAPQAINYQAVARTAQGLLIPDQQVGVRFTILEGSATGTILYQETANTSTNNFGLFTLSVGLGTPAFGTFNTINWGNGLFKYLKVEIAPGGGTGYAVQGTTIILSVPYSLYAEKTRLFAGNAISITNGNTIAATYKAANGIRISNDSISGAYKAMTGVRISRDTIYGDYIAGTGINITGNIISSTGSGSNYWLPDANGIYYQNALGGVGIGGNTEAAAALCVTQKLTGGASAAAVFKGNDTWHTVLRLDNSSTSPSSSYQIQVAGAGNTALTPGAFGLYRATVSAGGVNDRFVLSTDGTDNAFLAVGSYTNRATAPKSRLHVFAGDINIDQVGSGIILKSPNGQCWRITIDNAGNLVRTAITCP